MKNTKRYKCTTVKDKKNLQRTLNTFAEQYAYIAIEETNDHAYLFNFFDEFSNFLSPHIVFDKTISSLHLTETSKLLEANKQMFEHKIYQEHLARIIEEFTIYGKAEDKVIEINVLFQKEKESIILLLRDKLEKLSGKKLSERFALKLYTTLKNKILFPVLYSANYSDSKTYKVQPYSTIESIILEHYKYYEEYKWILESREDFSYYYWQIEEEPHNPIILEWHEFMSFMIENKIEDRLLDCARFLGKYIEPFIQTFYPYTLLPNELEKYKKQNHLFCFVSDKNRLHGLKLKQYLECTKSPYIENYRQLGLTHFAINKAISYDDQYEIYKLYCDIVDNNYESVFYFPNPSRQTFTPSAYDEYYYARYGDYPYKEEEEDNEQSEEEDEDESDEASSDPKTYFPSDDTTSDECPFGNIEEEKIEIPAKKPDMVPPPAVYEDDEIPF